jgi:hypothetical protein
MSASGCASKWAARVVPRSLIWRWSSGIDPTAAGVVAANAATTGSGAARCPARPGNELARFSHARARDGPLSPLNVGQGRHLLKV